MRKLKGKYQLQLDIVADDEDLFVDTVLKAVQQVEVRLRDVRDFNITKQGNAAGYTLSIKQPKSKSATVASLEEKDWECPKCGSGVPAGNLHACPHDMVVYGVEKEKP